MFYKHNAKSDLVLRSELKRRKKKRREEVPVSVKHASCSKAGVYRMLHFNSVELISQFMLF